MRGAARSSGGRTSGGREAEELGVHGGARRRGEGRGGGRESDDGSHETGEGRATWQVYLGSAARAACPLAPPQGQRHGGAYALAHGNQCEPRREQTQPRYIPSGPQEQQEDACARCPEHHRP